MPSTPTPSNRLRKQATGEGLNQWGQRLNGALDQIDRALDGHETIVVIGTAIALTSADYDAEVQAIARALRFTGVLIGNTVVTVPARAKWYFVKNDTTGAFTLTVKTAGGAGAALPQGKWAIVLCNGTDCMDIGRQLDQVDPPTAAVSMAHQRLINLAPGQGANDATTLEQLNAATASAAPLIHQVLFSICT